MVVEVENFFGVYMLYCTNPKFKGRIYVGYTVDPERRIGQHNGGRRKGGALRTSGTWCSSCMDFHPTLQLCGSENSLQLHLRVLWHMVRVPPWCRLPLTLRWLRPEYREDFPVGMEPPLHMPVAFGPVRAKARPCGGSRTQQQQQQQGEVAVQSVNPSQAAGAARCVLCRQRIQNVPLCASRVAAHCDDDDEEEEDERMSCFHPGCRMEAHITCLARDFLKTDPTQLLPVEGQCPGCKNAVLWGDLVRYKNGCYGDLEEIISSSQAHWADEVQF